MLAKLVVSAGAVLTLVACHGGDTVLPATGGPYELASLDQVCDGSLSARDVLDRVEREYLATLTYHDRPGTTPLRIRVAYEGGELTCHPHRDPPPGSRMASVPPAVSLEVRIALLTADGAFNESFVATLGGGRDVPAGWESPHFQPGDLTGTWDPLLPGHQDVSFRMTGYFDGAQTTGSLTKGGRPPAQPLVSGLAATWRN